MALATARAVRRRGRLRLHHRSVFITGRDQARLDQAVKSIGRNVTGVVGDAGNRADLDRLYETVKREKGEIDVFFASAGYAEFGAIGEVTEEQFDKIIGLNVRGTFFAVQKALPLFSDAGSIILKGSIASSKGFPAFGVYNASKAAIRSFARTWTVDLKARNIRVNTLSPGHDRHEHSGRRPKEAIDRFIAVIPRGKIGQPEEIATAALFLASSDSSFVTGIELFVDGGVAQI
jgi:NAD(P)-dependent dehydrogenase (short-subunit alcohol dehydrogenase family)